MSRSGKYNAKKVRADGYLFDSMAEHARYCELKLLQAAKEIYSLEVHPKYSLAAVAHPEHPGRGQWRVGIYEPDFVYKTRQMATVVEDVKGVVTDLARWKMKHFEIQYGIPVNIINMQKRRRAA